MPLEYEIPSAWLNESRKIQRGYLWQDLREKELARCTNKNRSFRNCK